MVLETIVLELIDVQNHGLEKKKRSRVEFPKLEILCMVCRRVTPIYFLTLLPGRLLYVIIVY